MARIAVPYGELSSKQLRALARIAREFDGRDGGPYEGRGGGFGHFTTRQNCQFNWIALPDSADVMDLLADVDMHGIQTSGNCIRNITSDCFAGVAADEIVDPRPYCEILRQWSTLHPEFAFLPRKFKIAVSGAAEDRAATAWHDIGLVLRKNDAGAIGFEVRVGGGMGRTPIIGTVVRDFLPWQEILVFIEAIVRVYNRYGRRDNMYKARIKILVKERTPAVFAKDVESEFEAVHGGPATVPDEEIARLEAFFKPPPYERLPGDDVDFRAAVADNRGFANWAQRNVHPHKVPGYAIVTLSLKKTGIPPGDATSDQMDAVAALADRYSFGELRVSHEQNLIFTDVRQSVLLLLWQQLKGVGFATPNIGLLTNIICCPGGDFCSLANAKSIPIAEAIQRRFDDLDYLHDIGELDLNISGCMNACGHHHVGHIGVLGVDKNGSEWYQVTIGGTQGERAALGKVIGPSFAADDMPDVVSRLIETYIDIRHEDERFVDTVQRVGIDPFKERVYATAH
jgi:sulfite reductase (NADPH) hemoprotein beta-component